MNDRKESIKALRLAANAILQSDDAKPFRGGMMHTFVVWQINEDGDESYHITVDECSPDNSELMGFLAKKLTEQGFGNFEIRSEW